VKNDVLNIISVFNPTRKAEMIYGSLMDKIELKPKDNVAKLIDILKMKKVYEEAVSILEG